MDLKHLLNQTTIKIESESLQEVTQESSQEATQESLKEATQESSKEIGQELEKGKKPEPKKGTLSDSDIVYTRFLVSWNKLEKGMKLNRILLFIESEKLEKELSDQQTKELKNLLFRGCDTGLFNKQSDVKYNIEEGKIESFKNLEFNESSKKYKLKTGGSKSRSVTKSRSNIDRLMKK